MYQVDTLIQRISLAQARFLGLLIGFSDTLTYCAVTLLMYGQTITIFTLQLAVIEALLRVHTGQAQTAIWKVVSTGT